MKTTSFLPGLRWLAGGLPLLLAAVTASAGQADLADRPLASMANGTVVRANLMFVLDDSGSMGNNYLPDDAPTGDVCFGWVGSNKIFYDPSRTYSPPLKSDGTSMGNATFTAAKNDGYKSGSSTVDLTNDNPETPGVVGATIGQPTESVSSYVCGARNDNACRVPSSTSTASYDSPSNTTTTIATTYARINAPGKTCKSSVSNSCSLETTVTTTKTQGDYGPFLWATPKTGKTGASCAGPDFDVMRADNANATQKQNYANWFSYYRTRMLAIRAGAGMAFAKIDPARFRVGFSKISEHANDGANTSGFLNIADFDAGTQKTDFFTRLYGTSGSGSTPLRPALARAGRYFANQLANQTDPMQYYCQRNYTILSTDGYWNQASTQPMQLDGTTEIGNQDAGSSVARPMRDEVNSGAGVGNTLADVAQYYYITDLRTPALGNCTGSVANQDVCKNEVPVDTKDSNPAQHMTTFTMGLGLNGTLTYDKDYETKGSGDYYDIKQGNKMWPAPVADQLTTIDDLWHTAVNGRGTYYSASNAADMAESLVDVLSKIEKSTGSSAAAATSSLTPSAGDDWLFIPLYTTKTWDGTVNAYKINTASGALIEPALWSAADKIRAQASRNIYFNSSNSLVSFTEANLTSAGKVANFQNLCTSGAEKLAQCTSMSSTAKTKATAANLINYLRGTTTYEQSASNADDKVFRTRVGPLGDIVNGAPVYVKQSPLGLSDAGYSTFAATKRAGVLYVGANDGMLHAIKVVDDSGAVDATSGTELWAYVPSMVMANMYILADEDYESKHRFFVDGAPVVGDVYDGTKWRTILVGGLGKGGKGYYALDITDPAAPKALWEYASDADLGYSFGNPIITKNKAGKWVVMFTSGYNNTSGLGYLYVVDAVTGALVDASSKIATSAGSAGTPSNLGKINAWVDDDKVAVASRVYGGDMLGNVWRFDFDDNYGLPGKESMLLAQTGSNQPITTKPVLTEIIDGNYKYPVVSVATGRYLGTTDVGDNSLQSIYTFKDDLAVTGLGALRSNPLMVKQTLKADRSGLVAGATINWATQKGWYVDFSLSAGERVNVDFDQQLNQLIVATNIPTPTVCAASGTGYLYYLDVGSGKPLLTYSSPTLVAGITSIVSSTGKLLTLVQQVDGKNISRAGADPTTMPAGALRRTSWRELMN